MFGTVARLRVKPGKLDKLKELAKEYEKHRPPGYVAQYVYQMEDDPNELFMAVLFESRETYMANADSPEQHEEYLQIRELLEGDPEWHDGTVVHATP